MVVLGLGVGSFYPTATTAGVTSVDDSQTSLAGGIVYMFQIAGGSIGLGLTTTVFSAAIPPFVDGVQAGFRLDAGLSLVGFVISLLFVGGTLLSRRAARRPSLTGLSGDRVRSLAAAEHVVAAGAAEQPVVRRGRRAAGRRRCRRQSGRRRGRRRASRRRPRPIEDVVAGAADQLVGAAAADQPVVAGAAAQGDRDRHLAARRRPSRRRRRR